MQYNSKYTSAIALLIAYVSMNVKKKKILFRETSAVQYFHYVSCYEFEQIHTVL